jgi:hypothetical protein
MRNLSSLNLSPVIEVSSDSYFEGDRLLVERLSGPLMKAINANASIINSTFQDLEFNSNVPNLLSV